MHRATPHPAADGHLPALCLTASPSIRPHRIIGLTDPTAFDALTASRAAQCRRDGEALAVLRLRIDTGTDADLSATQLQPLIEDCRERLARCVRRTDALVHQGGLNFGALLPGADEAAAIAVGERLRYACSGPYQLADRLLNVRLKLAMQWFAPPHSGAAPAPTTSATPP
jgi:GGDEF domain-containing protein